MCFNCSDLKVIWIQGHSHQIWSGQVTSMCVLSMQQLGVWNLDALRLFLSPFLHWNSGQITDAHLGINIYFPSLTAGTSFAISFQSITWKMESSWEDGLIRKTQKRLFYTVCSHLASFNTWRHFTYQCIRYMHVDLVWCPPSQATISEEKLWFSWNRTNWTAAMALESGIQAGCLNAPSSLSGSLLKNWKGRSDNG